MKKKIIMRSIVVIMVIGIIYEISTIVESFKENNTVLEDIETVNKFDNKKQMISIQIENDNDYGTHEYEDKSKWPDKNTYTYAGSLCTDWGGNSINTDGIIKFDELTYKVTVTTKKTVYCTLYFTKGKNALEHLKAKGGSKFNSTSAAFGLYRFNGLKDDVTAGNLNNYICFGTTDIATCTGADKQYYMYRIIGITDGSTTNTNLTLETNQLKIIRALPSSSQKWYSNSNTDIKWDGTSTDGKGDALVTQYLNGTFLTTDSAKWKDKEFWLNKITSPYWWIGDKINLYTEATVETTTKSNRTHQIGLMYRSDFENAGPASSMGDGINNWLCIKNGVNGSSASYELTMTRYSDGSTYKVYVLSSDGCWPHTQSMGSAFTVRPVFYLKPNVTLAGEGTERSPFIITSKN